MKLITFVKRLIRTLFEIDERQKVMLKNLEKTSTKVEFEMERNQLMVGALLSKQLKSNGLLENIREAEFKIFSQMGDDGIIQYLINNIEIPNKTFVEFGVENYIESNTRFLLMNNNWSGLVMDGSNTNIEQIRNSHYYWKFDLLAIAAFIDVENIESLIQKANFNPEVGILSIDIDGNDYWLWKKIDFINPIIVIVEYNSVFGVNKPWTIPYDSMFRRSEKHHSNLYYGSSLLSLCDLAETKGYYFVGCNSAGNNSYFIRKDKIGKINILKPEEGYVVSKFAESRDEAGNLTYGRGNERLQVIKSQSVFNTRTAKLEVI